MTDNNKIWKTNTDLFGFIDVFRRRHSKSEGGLDHVASMAWWPMAAKMN